MHRLTSSYWRRLITVGVLASSGASVPASFAQGTVQPIGDLPGGLGDSPDGISADGSVAVGFSYYIASDGLLQSHAYRWTQAGGIHAVFEGGLDYTSAALAVSGDGLTIGGWHAPTIVEEKAFFWSAAAGEDLLATRAGVTAVSGNGNFGAGYVVQGRGEPPRAAIWDASRHLTFIDSPNVIQPGSQSRGISADGTVVVGQAMFSPVAAGRAFRWTAATGMQNLGGPNFNDPTSDAYAVAPDGSVVVGLQGPPPGGTDPNQPARWTAAGGWQLLGNLPGTGGGVARAVSADGNTIVGMSSGRAFIWRQGHGLEELATVVAAPGWTFGDAVGISADGAIILASGSHSGGGGGPVVITLPCMTVSGDVSAAACAGGTITLNVIPSGAGPFTYQWRFDATPIDSIANPTAATATLMLKNVSANDAGSYDCVVTSGPCVVTSDPATLSVFAGIPGDVNGDGLVDGGDIQPFVDILIASGSPSVSFCSADLDHSGAVDAVDVPLMITALVGA